MHGIARPSIYRQILDSEYDASPKETEESRVEKTDDSYTGNNDAKLKNQIKILPVFIVKSN